MIGVRPPEYFPGLEYMALIQHVDHFVIADTFPYRGESFQNRSKIRDAQGWHWITIPLFGNPEGFAFTDVDIETGGRWQEKHWRSFLYNYRSTLYFSHLKESFRPFFESTWKGLGACLSRSVQLLTDLYGLSTRITRASQLNGAPERLSTILTAIGAEVWACSPARWEDSTSVSTDIQTLSYHPPTYRQNFEGFEPGMTAADLLFNYGPEARRILAEGWGRTAPRPS